MLQKTGLEIINIELPLKVGDNLSTNPVRVAKGMSCCSYIKEIQVIAETAVAGLTKLKVVLAKSTEIQTLPLHIYADDVAAELTLTATAGAVNTFDLKGNTGKPLSEILEAKNVTSGACDLDIYLQGDAAITTNDVKLRVLITFSIANV